MQKRYSGTLRGTPNARTTESMNSPQRRRAGSLRGQLVSHALISIALPLVLSGTVAFFFLAYHLDVIESSFARSRDALTRDIAGTDLRAQARNAARQLDEFLIERITEAEAWASSQVVVNAARAAHARHAAEDLVGAPIETVEGKFRTRKSLGLFPGADTYLRHQIAASPFFAEVFFTDRNGFNVALTNPTSDFVQSDEEWWQEAWSQHLSVGEIEFDDSAGVWSLDISIRIDDSATAAPVGVLKTVLAIEPVQRIADRTAQSIPGGRTLVTTGRGVLIAETSSDHDPERIMNPDINLSEQGEPAVREAFGSERDGFATDEEWIAGYARSGGRDTYAAATKRFGGFNWLIILQRPMSGIHEPISALRAIEDAMRDWRRLLAFSLGAMALASIILALFLAAAGARRLAASLDSVRELAERTARGESVGPAAITRPEEIVQVNEAVHRLSRVFMTVLKRSQPQQDPT